MHFMDFHPYFKGLEHLVTVDKEFVSFMTPHQQSIISACQYKFGLSSGVWLFSPDQVYVVLMERCPLWVHGRELGKRLYGALWSRMSDPGFSKTEQGLFTWLAIALQQEVYVAYCMGQLQPIGQTRSHCSAVLDRLDLVSDETTGLRLWQAQFCIENYEIVQVIGPISYLTQLFYNPRPIPVNYLRPAIRADQ